jgi:ketosteroid isomerase-like protein
VTPAAATTSKENRMPASTEDEIRSAEGVRVRALEAADVATLERLLTPDFLYVHASGRTEGKDAYLASLRSGQFRWSGFSHEDTEVRPLNGSALQYGLLHASKEEDGGVRQLLFRFVSVWVRSDDGWQLAFMQNLKPQLGAPAR